MLFLKCMSLSALFSSLLHLHHALQPFPSLPLSSLLFSFPLIFHSLALHPCHFDFPVHWPAGCVCVCVYTAVSGLGAGWASLNESRQWARGEQGSEKDVARVEGGERRKR